MMVMGPWSHHVGFLLGKTSSGSGEASRVGSQGQAETQSSPHPIARVWRSCRTLHPGGPPHGAILFPVFMLRSTKERHRHDRGPSGCSEPLTLLAVGLLQPTSAGPPALHPAPRHPVPGCLCSSPVSGCLHSVHTHATQPSLAPLRPSLYPKDACRELGANLPVSLWLTA